MAFTNFTVEGDVELNYFGDQKNDRQVIVKENDNDNGIGLEQLIAKSLNFPNSEEFDILFSKLEKLRKQNLQPADGTPDIVRTGTKLRITVEVI